jgi:hypothetical protein
MPSLGNRQLRLTSSKPSMTSMPDTPTNLALCLKTHTRLQRTSALQGGYCHGVQQIFGLSMLMHNCCTYDCLYLLILLCSLISMYVCHLLMHTCSCLCCLCMLIFIIYLLMGHDISEGIFHWTTRYGRKGSV